MSPTEVADHRHSDNLKPSNKGVTSLMLAVAERYNDLIHLHRRVTGNDLLVPGPIRLAYRRVRTLKARYDRGDLRHKPSEWEALKVFAQWTLDVKCELCNQPKQQLAFGDEGE